MYTFANLLLFIHCCIKCSQILKVKTLLQTYTAFTCRLYNKNALKKYLAPEIEVCNTIDITDINRLPLFQGSKAVYTVTKILPVIRL